MSHKSRPFTVLGKVFFVCACVCNRRKSSVRGDGDESAANVR